MTRRDLLRAGALSVGFLMQSKIIRTEEELRSIENAVDHILLGVSDLDYGLDWFERKSGVKAIMGGVHPGRGTRNALLSLGDRHYLEIIAPDPNQKEYKSDFDLRELKEPLLITWAASTSNIDALAKTAREAGLEVNGPTPGSRKKTDGTLLRWKTIGVNLNLSLGPVNPIPFFIQWEANTIHPSQDSPKGCELQSLALEHPEADRVKAALRSLGVEATVNAGKAAKLTATISTPKGNLVLT